MIGGVGQGGCLVRRGAQGGCGGFGGCRHAVYSGLLGARGGCASFSSRLLWWDWRWRDWGGVGLGEGMCSLVAGQFLVRLASFRTVSGGSVGHGSAGGLLLKEFRRW